MAAASPSPLASSVEKTSGAKLSRLLIDGGTTVLRNVFDGYHPPANLAADLTANYMILYNLKRKKALHQPQWNLLFPTSGVPPDSKTFDITLLFLLLTNICGLAPPLSGWHTKPPPTDTSFGANLARIKFYRNEVYGHITTTGVDAPTLNVLWQEISAVLVALGLSQAEIDRLKGEHCGEDDYLDMLRDWADSEKDIKSQLKGIRQCQIEIHQDVEKVLQSQQEHRKALEDSKSKLDEVHHTQTKIQETIMKLRQRQFEEQTNLKDRKSKLDQVHHMHTQVSIQEAIVKVRQTQLEDHGTVKDNRSLLRQVNQTQTRTQEIIEGVVKTQEEQSQTLQAVKQTVDSLKQERGIDKEDEVLKNLAKSEFKGDIEYHVGRFQEGTREWVFTKVQNWLDDRNSPNRVMAISANAGMGKSVVSAVVCKRMQEAGRLSGSHFCQHSNARYRNPQLMLQSLACHMCHALPEYKQALVKQLSRNLGKDLNNMGVEELFALLFKEPLSTVADPGRNMLMVIDGLDESEYQERNELLDVIANHFCKLPCWIRFLCTTRPERNIAEALKQLKPFQLEPNEEGNVQDIKLFLEQKTQYLMKEENKGAIVKKLVEKCEGLMLYAFFLASFIEENVSVLEQEDLDGSLPLAISSVYHSYFKRLENELKKELGVKEENFLNLLCAVTASREPLPIDFVSKVLVPSSNSPIARRKVLKAISSVSSLLPIRDGCLYVIHKSVNDWLTDTSCYGEHEFILDEKEGHRILASLCKSQLDNLKQKGVHDTQFNPTEKYALQHGVRHMLQLDGNLRQSVQRYVIDLELLYAKLCVSDSLALEEILWLQRQSISSGLPENVKDLLNILKLLLRKHFLTFTNYPQVVFQTLLNEGGSKISSKASNLLHNKYAEIPYMEFGHKQKQQGAVLARFQCSSEVACFDVSPQMDYMVCECKDGTIQLWSLPTGKLVWTRPVIISKLKFHFFSAFKYSLSPVDVALCYRSVAFHPTKEVVLPGVLSHAYSLDGDLEPLFPESNCRFTVCSISGDKTKILTACLEDARCIIMWSLENGSEITRIPRNEAVLSFAWSQDEKLLAISHSTGSIAIVDAMDGFRTLSETVIMPEVCGMIKLSSDCQSLVCISTSALTSGEVCGRRYLLRLKSNTAEQEVNSFVPWEFESHSEPGFLLGDPFSSDGSLEFFFVLNKQTVLKGSPFERSIDMLNIYELSKPEKETTHTSCSDIVFSLSGETAYVVRDNADVASGELIAQKSRQTLNRSSDHFVAVKEGFLLTTASGSLELWNFDLSRCIQPWTNINGITRIIPIAEERVACETENKVIILDTTSGEIVSTIPTRNEHLLTCNSKCQLLTYSSGSLHLWDCKTTLWRKKIYHSVFVHSYSPPVGIFSLSEQFLVIFRPIFESNVYILDSITGQVLHVLCEVFCPPDCKFVSDEVCVLSSVTASEVSCLKLFNVKSGDLLSVINLETEVTCLAACPRKRLLAIDQTDSKHGVKLIKVKLPQDKDSRKSQWALNPGDHEKVKDGEKEVCSCILRNTEVDLFHELRGFPPRRQRHRRSMIMQMTTTTTMAMTNDDDDVDDDNVVDDDDNDDGDD